MPSNATIHPLILLKELEESCKQRIATNASNSQMTNDMHQRGVGFRISDQKIIIRTPYVSEILDSSFHESISRVPAAKSWFLGLISLRGQPLPVIDFQEYLYGEVSTTNHINRLLVISHNNINTGLVVEEIIGLRYIPEVLDEQTATFPATLRKLLNGSFTENNTRWGELSIEKLTDDPEFINAAIG